MNQARKVLECHVKSFYTVLWVASPEDVLKAEDVHVHRSFVSYTSEDSEEPLIGSGRERRNDSLNISLFIPKKEINVYLHSGKS